MTSHGVERLSYEWRQGWDMVHAREKGKLDLRIPRTTTPQYQTEEDRLMAQGRES